MTNAELISKIKDEIERISSRAMSGDGQDICEYLLSFLSTLEETKNDKTISDMVCPKCLKEINECVDYSAYHNRTRYVCPHCGFDGDSIEFDTSYKQHPAHKIEESETTYDTRQYSQRPSVVIEDVARVQFASHAKVFDKKRKAVFDWEQFKEVSGIFYGFGKKDHSDTIEPEKPINPHDAMKEIEEKIALVKQRGTWAGVDVDKFMDEVRGREPARKDEK